MFCLASALGLSEDQLGAKGGLKGLSRQVVQVESGTLGGTRTPNLLIRSYIAMSLHGGAVAIYPSILLVKPPFADTPRPARFRPLTG